MAGNFFDGQFFGGGFFGAVSTATTTETPLGGSKPRKKVRGPYWDSAVYEAYIQRCIVERQAPRESVEVAVLKEALVDEVELRRRQEGIDLSVLIKENEILERLIRMEKAKRDLAAIKSRQQQIARQIQEYEDEEAMALLALFDEM